MRLTLPLLALVLACSTQAPGLLVDIEIVGANGRSPLGAGYDELKLWVTQPGRPVDFVMADTSNGTFDVGFPLASDTVETRVRVELVGEGPTLVGAPPPFSPLAAQGKLRIVVGEQGTCELLPEAQLDVARTRPSFVQVDTFGMVAGGLDDGGDPTSDVVYVDLLRMLSGRLADLDDPVGQGNAQRLGDFSALLVHDTAIRYDLDSPTRRTTPVDLHQGAGDTSAVVSLWPSAVVAGGDDTNEVSWVAGSGDSRRTRLRVAREGATGIALDDKVIIAGGSADGPVAEVLDASASESIAVEGLDDGLRVDPLLVEVPEGLWLIGGRGEDGVVRVDTVLLTGCPESCEASAGPDWASAREGVTYVPELGLLVGGVDSPRIERLVDGPTTELHSLLTANRAWAGAFAFESGMLVIAGGIDEGSARRDVEVCFPWTLRPL